MTEGLFMKRSGTLTVPYTFCLFCGLIALVLLMAGTAAYLAIRDTRASEASRATAAVHKALAPVTRAMSDLFDPSVRELQTLRQWAASGLLPGQHPDKWPSVLLSALSPITAIREIRLVKENGTHYHATRDDRGWSGAMIDPANPDASLSGSRWDARGTRTELGRRASDEADPRLASWYKKAISLPDKSAEAPLVAEGEDRQLTLATALEFPGGMRGGIALVLDASPIWEAAEQPGEVDILIDPSGARVGHMQDTQALALLREQALPGTSNAAFAQLIPGPGSASWYGAQSYRISDDQAWWVVGKIETSALPMPALPLVDYLAWSLGAGLLGAIALALVFGHRITRPLRQVAARARSISDIDEHYLPWPTSRFTEVNVLTTALEDIYETAVEHLDYHDAPLVVWAQPEAPEAEGMVEAEAVRHVFQYPRGNAVPAEAPEPDGTVIDVNGRGGEVALPPPIPAAQLQVIQGTRKELRRLQSQLAGASEELRTADNHYQQDQARMKRQRNCLRGLERILLAEGAASPTMLTQVREVLGASRVTLRTSGGEPGQFHLSGGLGKAAPPFVAPFTLLTLLQGESIIAVQESSNDPRLAALAEHPLFRGGEELRLLAPIKLAGKLLGFMVAGRAAGMGRWKGDEELFMMGVSHACAGVLWHQLRQRAAGVLVTGAPSGKSRVRNGNGNGNGHHIGNGNGTPKNGHVRPNHGPVENPTIFWEIDRAGCIKSIEGDVESLYGRTREQLLGQPITFLSDGAEGQRDMDRLAALLAGQRCTGYETIHHAMDGSGIHVGVRAKVWRDAGDRIIGARGTLQPISAAVAS